MSSSTLTYPLLAIPAYYIFSLTPHIYASALLGSNGYKFNNANPKASTSAAAIKGKVPEAVLQKHQRAESAHANNVEQMPLFAVAVLSSIMAERMTLNGAMGNGTGLPTFIGAWFAVRTAYSVAYVQISDHAKSFFRSALWAVGTGLATFQIYKAAQIIGS